MKYNRKILKIKSSFYYYSLLLFGSISLLVFTRCNHGPSAEEKAAHINDSIAKVKAIQDSIAKADSLVQAEKEQARLDSITLAEIEKKRQDSIRKAQKPHNPFKPNKPITKYGIPINPQPIAEYGPPPNTYNN
ncbi:MAG: hypothetical protein PHR81_08120 [Bacteroidales bacterium]|jgi:hypothetical protein|nr:hypothetical protein [Bacteroidales bacterium]MDD4214759.1 hypothetical protein [Bacteroidales bacterium]